MTSANHIHVTATTGDNLTEKQIAELRAHAASKGNGPVVEVCDLAAGGNAAARDLVAAHVRATESPAADLKVGDSVHVVTCLSPRRTAAARLTVLGPTGSESRAFEAVSTDGKTGYKGWVSTFFYEGAIAGRGDLCGPKNAGSSETILHVMTERPLL